MTLMPMAKTESQATMTRKRKVSRRRKAKARKSNRTKEGKM